MKKLTYAAILLSSLFFCSCSSNDVSTIQSGVKAVNKICTGIGAAGSISKQQEQDEENVKKPTSIAPLNSWDTKMMF